MSSALIAEFVQGRHYECFGLIIEYLLSIKNLNRIDIFVPKFNNDSFLKEWLDFNILNFRDLISIRLIHTLPPEKVAYQYVVYVTSEEYHDHNSKLASVIANEYFGIAHHVKNTGHRDEVKVQGFKMHTLSTQFKYKLMPIDFKMRIDKDIYIKNNYTQVEIDHFFGGIDYFVTGDIRKMKLGKLNNTMASIRKKCLILTRHKAPEPMDNLIFFYRAPTKILLYCLLRLTAIFIPNNNSIYYKGQISGLIHLAASFGCRLFIPEKIYIMQKLERFKSIIPFANGDDLLGKLP